MTHTRKLLERLAIFKELPEEEQRQLLEEMERDESLRQRLQEYREQDSLLAKLSKPRPQPHLRRDFYRAIEGQRASTRRGLASMVGGVTVAAGRVAVAGLSVALLVAIALMFRGQLQLATAPEQGALGDTASTATPLPTSEHSTLSAAGVQAPTTPTPTFPAYPAAEPSPTEPGMPYPQPSVTAASAGGEDALESRQLSAVLGPARLRRDSWSPNGRYFAFWQHEPQDYDVSAQYPPGDLSFYDAESGEICTYPRSVYDGAAGENRRHTWLSGERLLVFNDDGSYTLAGVCAFQQPQSSGSPPSPVEQVMATSDSGSHLLLLAEDGYYLVAVEDGNLAFRPIANVPPDPFDAAAFSPGAELLAVNGAAGGTIVVDVASAEVVQDVDWQSQGGLGSIFAPQWLDERSILVRSSADRGPLLLVVGEEPELVAPQFFGQDASPAQVAEGVSLGGGGYAVALFYSVGAEEYREGVWLYVSTRELAEELPFDRASFTPDGRRIVLIKENQTQSDAGYELWWAELASEPLEPQLLYDGFEFPYLDASMANGSLAVTMGNRLLILDDGGEVHRYQLPDVTYGGVPLWSPDGARVSTIGSYSGRPENLLYVIPAP